MVQGILSRGYGPTSSSGVTALYLDILACSFPDNSSYSFDPMKLKLCRLEDYDVE